ncbi:hypothetical protein EV127DRAFT_443681 [Xylaria flabelliformis]|nr:hypothetical protein EV127DRAFT_443681 [Xylaria flabelliformis]
MLNILEIEAANFLAFVGAQRPKSNSVFLLVMGMTGSGKSSFIADCTGREDAQIGHDLASCTNSVAIFRSELEGRDVYLIDTPGFDDTTREDAETLTAVAHYLSVSYANNVSINGILYLHRVSDTRVGSSTRRNLDIMKALCGEDAFENVAVMTTMWSSDYSGIEHAKQCSREQELRDIYLYDMLEKGSQIVNHKQCQTLSQRQASAKNILTRIFETWKDTKITLQIQHEMVDLNLTLKETSAGKALEEHIKEYQKYSERELQLLGISYGKDETQRHESVNAPPEYQSSDIRRMLAESNQALDAMRLSLLEIHKKQEQQFFERVSSMENNWKEKLREKEEEYRLKELEYRAYYLNRREEDLNQRERYLQERQANSRMLMTAQNALAYERETSNEVARQGYRQLTELREVNRQQHDKLRKAKRRDRLLEEELEKLKSEVKNLRQETQSKLDTTEKVKHEWVGPLLQGVASGGLGIVGSCITAGMLCCVQ